VLENLIRVGPPQGSQSEVKMDRTQKDNESKMRDDFKDKLKQAQDRHDDHEQVPKKLSGGNKKKAIKSDNKSESGPDDQKNVIIDQSMVLSGVVSKEDEVKTADTESDLLLVEKSESQSNQNKTVAQQSLLLNGRDLDGNSVIKQNSSDLLSNEQNAASEFKHLNSTESEIMGDISSEQISTDSTDQSTLDNLNENLGVQSHVDGSEETLKMNSVSVSQQEKLSELQNSYSKNEQSSSLTDASESQKSSMQDKIKNVLQKDYNAQKQDFALSAQVQLPDLNKSENAKNDSNQFSGDSDQKKNESGDQSLMSQQVDSKGFSQDLSSQISALHIQQQSGSKHLNQTMHFGANMQASATGHTPNTGDENVQAIINQAKFLVTKGGGEMTVKMTPEGMGEVQLKVMLDQGKVNIEMNSHDKNVKKLIEDSLSDLKSSLALHQMSVDHVKINNVDVVNATHNTQLQSNMNGSQSEQQQNQMLNQQFQSNSGSHQERQQMGSGFGNERNNQQQQQSRGFSESNREAQVMKAIPQIQKNQRYALNAYKGSSLNKVA